MAGIFSWTKEADKYFNDLGKSSDYGKYGQGKKDAGTKFDAYFLCLTVGFSEAKISAEKSLMSNSLRSILTVFSLCASIFTKEICVLPSASFEAEAEEINSDEVTLRIFESVPIP